MKKNWYEVWVLGNDRNGHAVEFEHFCGDFEELDAAKSCYNKVDQEYIDALTFPEYVVEAYVVLEDVISHGYDSECIDRMYEKYYKVREVE